MGGALREKSREVETPIRTDEAVADLANISSDTIRKSSASRKLQRQGDLNPLSKLADSFEYAI